MTIEISTFEQHTATLKGLDEVVNVKRRKWIAITLFFVTPLLSVFLIYHDYISGDGALALSVVAAAVIIYLIVVPSYMMNELHKRSYEAYLSQFDRYELNNYLLDNEHCLDDLTKTCISNTLTVANKNVEQKSLS